MMPNQQQGLPSNPMCGNCGERWIRHALRPERVSGGKLCPDDSGLVFLAVPEGMCPIEDATECEAHPVGTKEKIGVLEDQASTLAVELLLARDTIDILRTTLTELHAMVWGECSSLLNDDNGGNGQLDCRIRDLIGGANA